MMGLNQTAATQGLSRAGWGSKRPFYLRGPIGSFPSLHVSPSALSRKEQPEQEPAGEEGSDPGGWQCWKMSPVHQGDGGSVGHPFQGVAVARGLSWDLWASGEGPPTPLFSRPSA